MGTTELVTREQEHQTATSLYGDNDDLAELFEAVRKVAPWANDTAHPVSNTEVGLAIRRSVAMGLDPLNQHEVQIWKDNHGIHFQLAYTLTSEWVHHFHGEHTEPQYHRLGPEELSAEGLQENDVAFRVTFLMTKDIALLSDLGNAGYEPREARAMVEICGLGVANAGEYQGSYFAPAGRSRSWKVKKRALVDAYRRKFGTPTRSDIEELRRASGMANVKPQDWSKMTDPNPAAAIAMAKHTAGHREHQERLETDPEYKAACDERAKVTKGLLWPEPEVVEGKVTEMPTEPDAPPTKDATPTAAVTLRHTPKQLQDKIQHNIISKRDAGFAYSDPEHPLANYQGAIIANLEGCFAGDTDATTKRHAVTWYLTGKESTKDLDDAETAVLHKWLNASQDDDGQWHVDEDACREAHAVYAEAMRETGQTGLFDEDDPERPFTED